MVQKMIQAKESGKPKMKGVAEEKNVYPGQMIDKEMSVMTMQKITRDFLYEECFSDCFGTFFLKISVWL